MIRLIAAILILFAAPAAAFECHTALILALDASDSVDPEEADLQRRGIATALRDPDVAAALNPAEGYGALFMAFEWTNPGETQMIADWTDVGIGAGILPRAKVQDRGSPSPIPLYMNDGRAAVISYEWIWRAGHQGNPEMPQLIDYIRTEVPRNLPCSA